MSLCGKHGSKRNAPNQFLIVFILMGSALTSTAYSEERRRIFPDGSSRITISAGEYVFLKPSKSEEVNVQGCSPSFGSVLITAKYAQSTGVPERFVFDVPKQTQVEISSGTQDGSDLLIQFVVQGLFAEYIAPTVLIKKTEVRSQSGKRCRDIYTPYKLFNYGKMKKTGEVLVSHILAPSTADIRLSGAGLSRDYRITIESDKSQIRIPLEASFFSGIETDFLQLDIICVTCATTSGSATVPVVVDVKKFRSIQAAIEERARAEAHQRELQAAERERARQAERERIKLENERIEKMIAGWEREKQLRALELERQAEARRQKEMKQKKKQELLRNL